MALQLDRVLACSVVGSVPSWVGLDRKQQRGQDKDRKVRSVGRAEKASKINIPAHLSARGRKVASVGNARFCLAFHTLARVP